MQSNNAVIYNNNMQTNYFPFSSPYNNYRSKVIQTPFFYEQQQQQSNDVEQYVDQQKKIAVQPIIGEDIQKVKEFLLNKTTKYHGDKDFNLRDYTMFCFNINIGLRIGDFLHLKIADIYNNSRIVDYMAIREQKTTNTKKSPREIIIIPEVQKLLLTYINSMEDWKPDWYLFHAIHPKKTPYKNMSRQNVWYKMKAIEKELDSSVPLGTHSLRKTYARAMYDKVIEKDPMAIIVIQKMLGHSSPETTLAYIGITREKEIDLRMQAGLI